MEIDSFYIFSRVNDELRPNYNHGSKFEKSIKTLLPLSYSILYQY